MDKRFDVVALGELLIDFTANGFSNQGNFLFEANPGGAPCNVLAMLNKLENKTAFIGKVGDDFLGHHLKETIINEGINADGLLYDKKIPTTLAFVHTAPDGDRDFSFYRNPGADVMLSKEDIPIHLLESTKIFHFGSLSLTHENVREATKYAIETAKKNGALISFDPNLREPLWNSLEEASVQIEYGISQCSILKISDNEIQWFTGIEDYDEAVAYLREKYHTPFIVLSKGKDGSSAYWNNNKIDVEPFLQENTIETTGAGDTFCACILNGLLEQKCLERDDFWSLTHQQVKEMVTFANAAASLITTKKGALRVMPEKSEVEELIYKRQMKK